jgi:hypothetical protein
VEDEINETSEGSTDTESMSAPPRKRMRHLLDDIGDQGTAVSAFGMMSKTRLIVLT